MARQGLAPLFDQPEDPPGDDEVDGAAALEALGTVELAVLDAAPALEHPVIDLDAPAPRVPPQPLGRLLEVATATVVSSIHSSGDST